MAITNSQMLSTHRATKLLDSNFTQSRLKQVQRTPCFLVGEQIASRFIWLWWCSPTTLRALIISGEKHNLGGKRSKLNLRIDRSSELKDDHRAASYSRLPRTASDSNQPMRSIKHRKPHPTHTINDRSIYPPSILQSKAQSEQSIRARGGTNTRGREEEGLELGTLQWKEEDGRGRRGPGRIDRPRRVESGALLLVDWIGSAIAARVGPARNPRSSSSSCSSVRGQKKNAAGFYGLGSCPSP